MLGMHGSVYANYAMQVSDGMLLHVLRRVRIALDDSAAHKPIIGVAFAHSQAADVIIALGARFDDRVTGNLKLFAPKAVEAARAGRGGIIHFEISPKNVNKVRPASTATMRCGLHSNLQFNRPPPPLTCPGGQVKRDCVRRRAHQSPQDHAPRHVRRTQDVVEPARSVEESVPIRTAPRGRRGHSSSSRHARRHGHSDSASGGRSGAGRSGSEGPFAAADRPRALRSRR